MKYEYLDLITSDVAFRAFGATLNEVFCNAALAMMGIMYNLEKVPSIEEIHLEVEGHSQEALLYAWLSDILLEAEVNGLFFSEFEVEQIWQENDRYFCKGYAKGSEAKEELFETLVKGVTYHKFSLEKEKDRFLATVIVDI